MKILNVDMYPSHIERDMDWAEVAESLYEAQKMKKHFAQVELELLTKLKTLSENLSSKAGNFIFTTTRTRAAVDYNSIPELEGVNLEDYRKPDITRWKLTKI